MLCRLYLAAFHYNENAGRAQATSSTGHPLFKVNFPKARKRQCTVKQVKTPPTFRYLDDLQDLIFEHVFVDPAPYMDEVLKIPIPPDLCAEYERPDKEEVISTMVSRFNSWSETNISALIIWKLTANPLHHTGRNHDTYPTAKETPAPGHKGAICQKPVMTKTQAHGRWTHKHLFFISVFVLHTSTVYDSSCTFLYFCTDC